MDNVNGTHPDNHRRATAPTTSQSGSLQGKRSLSKTGRTGQQFGQYRLIGLLGQGRFSETYLGEQVELQTKNVVKVLKTRLIDEVQDSFLDETRILSQLVHPNIERILDFGIEGHMPYLVLDYLPHGTMRQRYPEGVVHPLTSVLPSVKQIALALQYAHQKGILHLNVRPENMLLGWNNEVLLSDFALNAVARSRRQWGMKEVTGTIAYMAPEQIQGKPSPASDQYALGLVIYEWLSGNHPFCGSFVEIAQQQLYVPPPSLRRQVPTISPDVEKVILTALAKDPKRRFASLTAFINALEQAQQFIVRPFSSRAMLPATPGAIVPSFDPRGRPAGSLSRRKFLIGLAGLAAVGGAGALVAFSQRIATPSLATSPTPNPASLTRGSTLFTYHGHIARVSAVAWSPDGKRIASSSDDRVVQVCDGSNGTTTLTYRGHAAEVYAVAWSPDGKYIASAGADSRVQVWDASTGHRLFTHHGHTDIVNALAWSRDSKYIASASDDHTVQVWDPAAGKQILVYGGHNAGVLAVAWSPNGQRLASGSWDTTVQIWHPTGGDPLLTYRGHSAEVYSLAWSPDGKRLASASGDTVVQVGDAEVGTTIYTYKGHAGVVLAVAWSPAGQYVASAGYDNAVHVWHAATGRDAFSYGGHFNWVDTLAWSPDSKRIASAGYDSTMQVWQAI